MSVPHSGTRTLVAHLGMTADDLKMIGGRWWHFGYHDHVAKRYKCVHLHIPVRHPLDVAHSWARQEKNINRLLNAYDSMFEHLDKREHTLHHMELLPRLEGVNQSPEMTGNPFSIERAQDIVREQVIRKHLTFFQKFYPEIEG